MTVSFLYRLSYKRSVFLRGLLARDQQPMITWFFYSLLLTAAAASESIRYHRLEFHEAYFPLIFEGTVISIE